VLLYLAVQLISNQMAVNATLYGFEWPSPAHLLIVCSGYARIHLRCIPGVKPDLKPSVQAVPGLRCQFWYTQCLDATRVEVERDACGVAHNATCGTRDDASNALLQSSQIVSSALLSRSLSLVSRTRFASTYFKFHTLKPKRIPPIL
jgi:hypothetical protein